MTDRRRATCGALYTIPGPGYEPSGEAVCGLEPGHDTDHRDPSWTVAGRPLEWSDDDVPLSGRRVAIFAGATAAAGVLLGLLAR